MLLKYSNFFYGINIESQTKIQIKFFLQIVIADQYLIQIYLDLLMKIITFQQQNHSLHFGQ